MRPEATIAKPMPNPLREHARQWIARDEAGTLHYLGCLCLDALPRRGCSSPTPGQGFERRDAADVLAYALETKHGIACYVGELEKR